VLKAAAHTAASSDPDRHLRDMALLASLITDHATKLPRRLGSDGDRLRHLRAARGFLGSREKTLRATADATAASPVRNADTVLPRRARRQH